MNTFDDAELVMTTEIEPSERLLWAGKPRQGVFLRASDAFLIPFSLMWGGFAIFWEATVVSQGAPFFFALWGIPFVLVGLYFIVGRFVVDAWCRARTVYGVTSERIVIISHVFHYSVKSLNLATLTDVTLYERSDRSGTISFGLIQPIYFWWWWTNMHWMGSHFNLVPTLESVENAKSVYVTIRTAQREHRNQTG